MTLQQSDFVAFNDLNSAAGKSRALSEGLLRMVEGLGKGAGLALLAVPTADAFVFSQAQFKRILSNYLGLEGAISIPLTHHCGGGAVRVLTQGTVNHLQVCPQNGVTDASVVETRIAAADTMLTW